VRENGLGQPFVPHGRNEIFNLPCAADLRTANCELRDGRVGFGTAVALTTIADGVKAASRGSVTR
jgi:hypothetical protein